MKRTILFMAFAIFAMSFTCTRTSKKCKDKAKKVKKSGVGWHY